MSLLKKVTVLLEDESDSRSNLTRDLGSTIQPPFMCRLITPTKVYVYDIFGLMTMDSKITDYLKTRDGLIIIINSPTNEIVKRINTILTVKNFPILIFDKSNTIKQVEKDNLKISWLKEARKLPLGVTILHTGTGEIKQSTPTSFATEPIDKYYEGTAWLNDKLLNIKKLEPTIKTNLSLDDLAINFVNTTLPIVDWDHRNRLRIVYYSLCNVGLEKTMNPNGWLCRNWRKYKTSIGHGNLWNYTLTMFYAKLIYKNMFENYSIISFDDLYNAQHNLQNARLFNEYYSNEVLFTPFAKENWVEPNLKAL